MPLKLEQLTANTIVETGPIRTDAFRSNPGTYAIRPNNNSPEVIEWVYRKNLGYLHKSDHYLLGVRDETTCELIGFAHWQFSRATTRANEAFEEQDESMKYAPGSNHAAQDEMNAGLEWGEKEMMGESKDYWRKSCPKMLNLTVVKTALLIGMHPDLHMLAISEAHQGKGAGTMLLQWGQQRAATDGVQAFLDSTVRGKPVYEKAGFVAGKEWNIDYSKYGVNHWNRQFPMVWTPPRQ